MRVEIGRAFAPRLVPNHQSHLPAAPLELAGSRQHNRAVARFDARRYRAALWELVEDSQPAELNDDPIFVHHDPLDEIQQKRALGAVRS